MIKFFTAGSSPELRFLSSELFKSGFVLTNNDGEADFALVADVSSVKNPEIPTIIISSGDVYAALGASGDVECVPFREDNAIVLPSTKSCLKQAVAVQHEAILRFAYPNHAVLRMFDVYGIGTVSVVEQYINCAKDKIKFPVLMSPHRQTSCLHADDLSQMFLAFVKVFVEKSVRGVYNLGSSQGITFKHLAETALQICINSKEKPDMEVLASPKNYVNWYHVPDTLRFCAITGASPKVSLRRGIWQCTYGNK